VPVAEIVATPVSEIERLESYAHARLPLPEALYADRRNSRGIDLGNPPEIETLRREIYPIAARSIERPAPSSTANCCPGTRIRDEAADRRESGRQHTRCDSR